MCYFVLEASQTKLTFTRKGSFSFASCVRVPMLCETSKHNGATELANYIIVSLLRK